MYRHDDHNASLHANIPRQNLNPDGKNNSSEKHTIEFSSQMDKILKAEFATDVKNFPSGHLPEALTLFLTAQMLLLLYFTQIIFHSSENIFIWILNQWRARP